MGSTRRREPPLFAEACSHTLAFANDCKSFSVDIKMQAMKKIEMIKEVLKNSTEFQGKNKLANIVVS